MRFLGLEIAKKLEKIECLPEDYPLWSSVTRKTKSQILYGILERQFRNYYDKASNIEGSGDELLILLEKRFDNVFSEDVQY